MLTGKPMRTIRLTFHTNSLKLLSRFCSTSFLDNVFFVHCVIIRLAQPFYDDVTQFLWQRSGDVTAMWAGAQ